MSDMYWLNPFYCTTDPEPILRDAFKWATQGIFVAMQSVATTKQIELPWGDQDSTVLDLTYFGNHSGAKFCAPVVKLFLQTEELVDSDGQLNQTGTEKLAELLLRKYLINWQKLWNTNEYSYSPIHNYDMTEERGRRKADSETEISESQNDSETSTSGSVGDMTYKYGINTQTDSPKPSDKVDTSTEESVESDSTMSSNRNKVGAEEEEETIHRAGNIGVTTTQKLLQEERELWLWNYFDQIFSDLDKELALSVHDPCRV